jgi:hypothetical protein
MWAPHLAYRPDEPDGPGVAVDDAAAGVGEAEEEDTGGEGE